MNDYEEALDVVLSLIKKNENIILYGSGSNGKSYLINQLKENLKQYVVYHEFDINLINKQSIKPMVKSLINTVFALAILFFIQYLIIKKK